MPTSRLHGHPAPSHHDTSALISLRISSLDGAAREQSWSTAAVRIGSDPASDLVVSGRGVAAHHCVLEHTAAGVVLRDLGARATFINSEPLDHPRVVRAGDRIYVGEAALELVAARSPAPRTTAPAPPRARPLAVLGLAAAGLAVFVLARPPAPPPAPSPPARPAVLQPSPAPPPEPEPEPEPPTREPVTVHHEVIPGELLADIAARYHVSVQGLARSNHLSPDVPPPEGTVLEFMALDPPLRKLRLRHTVEAGDTWAGLSERFDLDVELLRRYNQGIRGELVPGSEFIVWVDPHISRRRDVPGYSQFKISPDARSVGAPSGGSLERGIQLPPSSHYERIYPDLQYGSSHTIEHLQRGIAMFRQRYDYEGVLVVANLSHPAGGPFHPHQSHQSGRDVDIWLPALKGTYQAKHLKTDRKPKFAEINWFAAWGLVESLLATGEVKYVFLDSSLLPTLHAAAAEMGAPPDMLAKIQLDPSSSAPVRHAAAHTGHFHVRFRCGQSDLRCSERPEIEEP